MAGDLIHIVGGPMDGKAITGPCAATLCVPGAGGFGMAVYTLRKCRDRAGGIVHVLAPAGRDIDPVLWRKRHKPKRAIIMSGLAGLVRYYGANATGAENGRKP